MLWYAPGWGAELANPGPAARRAEVAREVGIVDRARFDCFTRALSGAGSRRQAAKTLAGGMLGLAGIGVAADALAGCGHKGQKCATNRNCCGGLKCKFKEELDQVGECRYKHGCGRKGNFCTQNRDCCGGFRCQQRKCQR